MANCDEDDKVDRGPHMKKIEGNDRVFILDRTLLRMIIIIISSVLAPPQSSELERANVQSLVDDDARWTTANQ